MKGLQIHKIIAWVKKHNLEEFILNPATNRVDNPKSNCFDIESPHKRNKEQSSDDESLGDKFQ